MIIGAGVIGSSTGKWLDANAEEVIFNDIDKKKLQKLEKEGYRTTLNTGGYKDIDIYWICTAEWNVEDAIKTISYPDKIVAVRSTVEPYQLIELQKKYNLPYLAHVPEFLRAGSAIDDIFNPDRVIIGSNSQPTIDVLKSILSRYYVNIVETDFVSSALIKLVSNAWLSTQISFWNDVHRLFLKMGVNPQLVSNAVTMDKRISKYGSKLFGSPAGGFCLPKDIDAMIKVFESQDLDSILLVAVKKMNKSTVKNALCDEEVS